ncbi:Gfo/Idh/MocA family protein [Chloroflexota bacterium]
MEEALRVAVIGCGQIGQGHHIPSLQKIKDVELVAVCDTDINLAKETARKFNISSYYTDISEMLGLEKLDIVDICTPPQTHRSLCIQAAEANCHVLLEKPMALSLKEAGEMAEVAEQNNIKIGTVHNKLFEPVMMKALTMVNMGVVGDMVGMDIQVLHSKRRSAVMLMNKEHWCHNLPAGILGETLPHPLYLAAAFMGKLEPVRVYSRKLCNYDWVIADEIKIILNSERCTGTISFACNSPQSKTIIDIHGTKKHLRVDLFNSAMTEYGSGTGTIPSRAFENLGQCYSILANSLSAALKVISGQFRQGHHTLIKRFVESIRYNTEPPVTLEEARDVTEAIEKITAQIRTISG